MGECGEIVPQVADEGMATRNDAGGGCLLETPHRIQESSKKSGV